ncbi:MAG: hypothetical protein L3J29_09160 [Cyclobacteriaceae bacterium]|nr:hypothetical protein [Cyclobacteriaceae bacterium]
MIVMDGKSGLRNRIGYKEIAKKYFEFYEVLVEDNFVINMISMFDEWEEQDGIKFEQIMPSDWDMILKAIKVLNIEPAVVSN